MGNTITQTNPLLNHHHYFVHTFWPTSLQLGEVQHFIKHQCQVRYTPSDCWKAITFILAYTEWNDKVQNEISNKYKSLFRTYHRTTRTIYSFIPVKRSSSTS